MNNTNFVNKYISILKSKLDEIDHHVFDQIISCLLDVSKNSASVYIIGNGGSSATGSHMVNDLGSGLSRKGLLDLKIFNLSDNIASVTALGNDVGFDNIFYYQLFNKLQSNDVLIAISCSGNSPNILKAVKYAKERKNKIISLTGFDGGYLKELSDISYHVQTNKGDYGIVEDMHMILDHMIYTFFHQRED